MITKQTCSILRGLLIPALYRKQVSLINRWIKENKRRMAVFSFILTCAFSKTLRLQIFSNYMAYPINSLIDELISLRPRSVFFSLFFTDSRGFTFHDQISSELRIGKKHIFNITQNGMHKSSELWGYQQLRTQVPTERTKWRHPLFWLCLALYSLSAFQSH